MNKNPLDVEEIFGIPIPEYKKPPEKTLDLPGPIIPKKVKKVKPKNNYEGGLVAASGPGIYALLPEGEVKLITERSDWIYALCSHNGELYDAGRYEGIYNTLKNQKIAERRYVYALCSHNGELFDGGDYKAIYNTLKNQIIAERSYWVRALCSHNGELFNAGRYEGIYNTLKNQKIAKRTVVNALCSHNGELYDGGDYKAIYNTSKNKKIAERSDLVYALCSHNGELYDGGHYEGVYNTLKDPYGKNPIWELEKSVFDLISVDQKLWEKILAKIY